MIFGALLIQHVPRGWKHKTQRPSGLIVLIICGILIATGWGLYYCGGEYLRRWISGIHTYLGLALPFILWVHILLARRLLRIRS